MFGYSRVLVFLFVTVSRTRCRYRFNSIQCTAFFVCVKYHLRVIIVRHLRVQNGKIIESERQAKRQSEIRRGWWEERKDKGRAKRVGRARLKVHLIIEFSSESGYCAGGERTVDGACFPRCFSASGNTRLFLLHMQWPVTACSKLRVDYNEHQVKLTVSIEAAGAAGKTRKQRKKRNDSESFDCVGGLLARGIDGLVGFGFGLESCLFGGWYAVVSDICRHILRLRPGVLGWLMSLLRVKLL